MRVRQLHPQHAAAKINVTPLIDVVMVLIIFYLIVGKMASDHNAQVSLPTSSQGVGTDGSDKLVVTVTADEMPVGPIKSRVLVDGVEVETAGLAAALRAGVGAHGNTKTVEVRADRRLTYGAVDPVVKACREAGLTTLRLITERAGGGGGGR